MNAVPKTGPSVSLGNGSGQSALRLGALRPCSQRRLCGAALTNRLRASLPQEIEHRRRIHRLKMAEGNASAGALAMGLEIEQQHCKSVRVEQFRAVDHALSIGSHSVHEQNGTAARPARHQPSMQR
jgi:hypothetical protein